MTQIFAKYVFVQDPQQYASEHSFATTNYTIFHIKNTNIYFSLN